MSILYFIRHGQASFGAKRYDRLSEKGRLQSRLLAEHLLARGVAFDAVYAGTLSRQAETAAIVAGVFADHGQPLPAVRPCQAFNEYDSERITRALIPLICAEDPALARHADRLFSDRSSFQMVFERVVRRWLAGTDDLPGVEKWRDFSARVREGLAAVMAADGRGRHVAVFTSGGPIALAARQALHLEDADAVRLSWQIVNASVTRFKCTHDALMLSTFNEHGHLEAAPLQDMVTYR